MKETNGGGGCCFFSPVAGHGVPNSKQLMNVLECVYREVLKVFSAMADVSNSLVVRLKRKNIRSSADLCV